MQQNTELLTKLVFERGLCTPKATKDLQNEDILGNDELLALVAGLNHRALTALVKARIDSIALDLVQNAAPAEVIIFRQAMLEIAMLLDDHTAYEREFTRRDADKKGRGETTEAGVEDAPTLEDNGQEPGTTAVL